MKLTIMFIGHSGVGKSPLVTLLKDQVKKSAPYRVRPNPRNNQDIYYVSQEVRDTMKALCAEKAETVCSDIELFPSMLFFKVRGDDQFIVNISNTYHNYVYFEIFAPVLSNLLEIPAAKEYYPFLVSNSSHRVLILILNSAKQILKNAKFDFNMLEAKVEHAVRCRHILEGTDQERISKDVDKRKKYLKEEFLAWKSLLNKKEQNDNCQYSINDDDNLYVIEINDWQFLEYTYKAETIDNTDDVSEKMISEENLLEHQKTRLIAARDKIIKAISAVNQDIANEVKECCFKSEKEIKKINTIFV